MIEMKRADQAFWYQKAQERISVSIHRLTVSREDVCVSESEKNMYFCASLCVMKVSESINLDNC